MECSRSSSKDCLWHLEGLHGNEDDLPGTMKDGFGSRQASCKGPPTLQAGGLPVGEQREDGPERAVRPADSHPRGTGRQPCRTKEPDPSAKPDLPWYIHPIKRRIWIILAGAGGPRGAVPRSRSGGLVLRRYPSSKVRSSCEEIPTSKIRETQVRR